MSSARPAHHAPSAPSGPETVGDGREKPRMTSQGRQQTVDTAELVTPFTVPGRPLQGLGRAADRRAVDLRSAMCAAEPFAT